MSNDISIICKKNGYILALCDQKENSWTIKCRNPADNSIKEIDAEFKWMCEVVIVQKDDEYILKDIKPPCIERFPNLQKIRNASFKTPENLLEKFGNTVYP